MPQAGHIDASKTPHCLPGETMDFSKPATGEELLSVVPDNDHWG